jgi:hypothetical protein
MAISSSRKGSRERRKKDFAEFSGRIRQASAWCIYDREIPVDGGDTAKGSNVERKDACGYIAFSFARER